MSKQRNIKSHRQTEANERRTIARIEEYEGVRDLLRTWDLAPDDVQIENHEYILELRRRERNVKNYILHRSNAKATI